MQRTRAATCCREREKQVVCGEGMGYEVFVTRNFKNIKKMKSFTISLFLLISFGLQAQTTPNDYKKTDETIRKYDNPIDHKTSVDVARFIYENFSTETEKLRAAFVWIAENFDYDVENMFTIRSYSEPQELVDEMLANRKGVCMHFAYLFNEITENILGIKTHIISGVTKQDGAVHPLSHVWCACFADSAWHLIDPTWGAGYVQNNKYVKKLNDDYFKTAPEKLIQSHNPHDPLWQFLHYPVSAQEFYDGHTAINKEKPFFNYLDTLAAYENAPRIEQLLAINRRIVQNGVKNAHTQNQLENNEKEIEFYKQQIAIDYYNSAVNYYNDGVNLLNKFINYRNNQFTPQSSDIQIKMMVDDVESALEHAQNELQKISTNDANTISMIYQLQSYIQELVAQMNEQKDFVNKYVNTKPAFRKSLFYKYYWMGIPLN
jgi:hypothetical protein